MKVGHDVAKTIAGVTIVHHNIRNKRVKNYRRGDVMVFIPLEGSLELVVKNQSWHCRVGDAIVLGPHIAHGLYSSERAGERLIVMIPPALLKAKLSVCRIAYTRLMNELILFMLNHENATSALHKQSLALFLEHLKMRLRAAAVIRPTQHLSLQGIDPRIRKAILFIEENFAANPAVANIAKYAGLSVRNLTRLFKSEVGMTLRGCLNTHRMNRAFEMLHTGRYRVAEVCEDLGFASVPQFSKDFKRRFGKSPGSLA